MQNVKQSSILDFFKRKNNVTSNLPSVASKLSSPNKSCISENSNKRCLESDENEPINKQLKSDEPTLIDVSLIPDGILNISFDCQGDDPKAVLKEVQLTEELPKEHYIPSTFRSIVGSIISDPHHMHLFDDDDWNVVKDFTCLPGRYHCCFNSL